MALYSWFMKAKNNQNQHNEFVKKGTSQLAVENTSIKNNSMWWPMATVRPINKTSKLAQKTQNNLIKTTLSTPNQNTSICPPLTVKNGEGGKA